MPRQQTVVSLDPIDRKKRKGFFGRLLITRWYRGRPAEKFEPYGHYMFCGPQRSGKTASALWYTEQLIHKYSRRRIKYEDSVTGKFKRFSAPPTISLYSNFGVGESFTKESVFDLIDQFDPYANEIRIVLIDEIHTYFPKGASKKMTKDLIEQLTAVFSQLAKRNCFLLSTAQVYGRLDKALREQCLYMVNCSVTRGGRLVNEVILESDIIADDLGRWAGDPKFIWRHGLATLKYDTRRLIRE